MTINDITYLIIAFIISAIVIHLLFRVLGIIVKLVLIMILTIIIYSSFDYYINGKNSFIYENYVGYKKVLFRN